MKKILIAALSILLCVLSAVAQENFYIINGKHVADFDGSQLVGMQIKFYEMKHLEHLIIHNIYTTDNWMKIEDGSDIIDTVSITTQSVYDIPDSGKYTIVGHSSDSITETSPKLQMGTMRNPLIILDGEIYTGKMSEINQANIRSMSVYKPGSNVALTYGENGKNGVIKIFTQYLPDAITYFIDGKLATKEAFNNLSPEIIKRVTVLKRGSSAAISACPEGKTNDIYQITTK